MGRIYTYLIHFVTLLNPLYRSKWLTIAGNRCCILSHAMVNTVMLQVENVHLVQRIIFQTIKHLLKLTDTHYKNITIYPVNQLHKFSRTIIMNASNRHIFPYYSFPYYLKKLRSEIQDSLLLFVFDDENLYRNDFPVCGLVLLVRLVEIGPLSKCR